MSDTSELIRLLPKYCECDRIKKLGGAGRCTPCLAAAALHKQMYVLSEAAEVLDEGRDLATRQGARIAELEAERDEYAQCSVHSAGVRIKSLEAALVKSVLPLEAIAMSVQWELCPELLEHVRTAVKHAREALEPSPTESTS